jgi:siroheme synthase
MTPRVALVGAGPGQPELVTLRAEALLAEARIVIVDASLVDLARAFAPTAELVAVADGGPAPKVVLSAVARAEANVVRLYCGDPWLHAAYESEHAALEAAGHPHEAVAGVAVEVALPALAGVAVHVRSLAVACTIGPFEALSPASDPARTLVTSIGDPSNVPWDVAAAGDTDLPAALVPVSAPAAVWRGRLGDVIAPAAAMHAPALLVVGAVCAEHGGDWKAREPGWLATAPDRAAGAP